MTDFFHVGWTPKDFWTPLFVGRFGWFDYGFPPNVNNFAFVVYARGRGGGARRARSRASAATP